MEKFEPQNLREAHKYMEVLLRSMNEHLDRPYTILDFASGDCPIPGIKEPGFVVRTADQTRDNDPLSLILVHEVEAGYQYPVFSCLDPSDRHADWARHLLDDPATAAAFGMAGIVIVRFLEVAKEVNGHVKVAPRPGDPAYAAIMAAAGGEVRH